MKLFVVLLLLLATGCTSYTRFGACVGVGQDRNPHLEYKISTWNVFVGVVMSETILPPIIVLASETFCPVGIKDQVVVNE